jgi:hypothetical protein
MLIISYFSSCVHHFSGKIRTYLKRKLGKEDKDDNLGYYFIHFENLEQWAIKHNLHDKVPKHLWLELQKAKDDCKNKNITERYVLNLKNLNIRNEDYDNLIKINKKIIDHLKK